MNSQQEYLPSSFVLALAEQEELIRRAIMAAGYTAEQEELAVGDFAAVARDERQRIVSAPATCGWA